jgi:hypothetical protein
MTSPTHALCGPGRLAAEAHGQIERRCVCAGSGVAVLCDSGDNSATGVASNLDNPFVHRISAVGILANVPPPETGTGRHEGDSVKSQ